MYNLFVSGFDEQWNQGSWVLENQRYLQYTNDVIKEKFGKLTDDTLNYLMSIPVLLAYESRNDRAARIGKITSISRRLNDVEVQWEVDPTWAPIASNLIEKLSTELDIDKMEMYRTHWSIKDVDVYRVLRNSGIKKLKDDTYVVFSNSTVLRAIPVLESLGHSDLDRLVLELGIEENVGGRELGNRQSRVVSITKFALANSDRKTPDGVLLPQAIVNRAIDADPDYPKGILKDVDLKARTLFWQGVNSDSEGQASVVMRDFGAFPGPAWRRRVESVTEVNLKPKQSAHRRKSVFIVHGRDEGTKNAVSLFVNKAGFEDVVLHNRPNKGRTIITKFSEEAVGVEFAIVIMSPDDIGGLPNAPPRPRARQNVIFELGFFIGVLGAPRVCALIVDDVEIPSDFDGVVFIKYDAAGAWKNQIAREWNGLELSFDHSCLY